MYVSFWSSAQLSCMLKKITAGRTHVWIEPSYETKSILRIVSYGAEEKAHKLAFMGKSSKANHSQILGKY